MRDKAEFLQAVCGYASALCHCTLVLIASVKLLQMNLLLLLPLGCISFRLSQSGEERCSTALNAILSNFYLPCTVHSNRLMHCGMCSPSLVSLLKSYITSIQDATSLLKTSPNTGEARAATTAIVRRDKTTLPCKTLWLCFLNWQPVC